MNYFQDTNGVVFSTTHGQVPASPQNVTINNSGQTSAGYWNGSYVVKY